MSAVTLQEIADLVAIRLKVPVAAMRGLTKGGRAGDAATASARDARSVVFILAWKHTQARFTTMSNFFGMTQSGTLHHRIGEIIDHQEGWLAANPALRQAVEEVEQQIDALHDRRMAERDRKAVRV